MKVKLLISTVVAVFLAAGATTAQAHSSLSTLPKQIKVYRAEVNHMRTVMGVPAMQYAMGAAFQGWVLVSPRDVLVHELVAWKRTTKIVRWMYGQVPNKNAWLCIHRGEGAWNDPNSPFWGGLQMDMSFQRAYGSYLLRKKGTADNWTPLEQMWTAEKARRSGRGFYPWPNTARNCGLI